MTISKFAVFMSMNSCWVNLQTPDITVAQSTAQTTESTNYCSIISFSLDTRKYNNKTFIAKNQRETSNQLIL